MSARCSAPRSCATSNCRASDCRSFPMRAARCSPATATTSPITATIMRTALGPMSPGTAYVLLHHYMGEVDGSVGAWGYARGGMGAVTKALAASFKASGGTIRTGAEVDHVLVSRGKAKGVVLAGGEE